MLKKNLKKNKKILAFSEKYNLLPDLPLTADDEQNVKFGHSEIAKVVADLVFKANPPYTIGLFGKWGTGKTTIINLAKYYLEKQGIKTVIFDVWKYESDSLRRQFLITLDEDLGLNKNYKEHLNQSLTKPYDLPFRETLHLLTKNLLFRISGIIFIFLAVVMLILAFVSFGLLKENDEIWKSITSIGIVSLILGFILQSFQIVSGMVHKEKTDSAEGFENIFYNEILPKIEKKILIAIDNLDRTTHKKAVSLLSDIKTFLSKNDDKNNKVIFIIACDEEAIKKHLERSNYDDPEEFLRKFFNTSLKIPRFLGEELDEYTRSLLNETGIEELKSNYELEWLITYTFRDNPREIKQFINTLISHYLLAKQMEKNNQIVTEGIITKNVDALAKLLIIRQKYPKAYNSIEKMALRRLLNWREIEKEPEKIFIEIFSKDDTEERLIAREKKDFKEFTKETNQIDINNLPIFVRLKQSEQEQNLPGLEEYIVAAESRKMNEAKDIFNKFSKDKIESFDDVLKGYIQKAKKADKLPKIWVLGATTIEITGTYLKPLKCFLRELALNFPTSSDLLRYIDDYAPKKMFKRVYPLLRKRYQNNIIQSYLSLFGLSTDQNTSPISEKYALELLEIITKHKDDFIKYKETVREGVKNYFYTDQFLSVFVNNNLEKEFITDETKGRFIESVKNDDLNNLDTMSKKLKLLSKLNLKKVLDKVIQKINELIRFETQQGTRIEQRLILVNFLKEFLNQKSINGLLEESQNKPTTEAISTSIVNWYNQDANPNNRLLYFRVMNKLREIKDNNQIPNLESRIKHFISNMINIDIIDKFLKQELNYSINFCPQEFRTAIRRIPGIFDRVHNLLPKNIIDQIIIDLINSHPRVVPQKLKLINYKLENPVQVVSSMLSKQQNLENAFQEQYFYSIAKMQCGNDATQIERYYNVLLGLKGAKPEIVKKYSRRRFFNTAQKKALQGS